MSKVLITGSGGFIGSYLMKELPGSVGYDLKDGNDVRDTAKLIQYIQDNQISKIVHLAALASVPGSWDDPVEFVDNNVVGAMSVIKAALATGIKKIVYSSSSSCKEPTSSPYAMSKYGAELLFITYATQIDIVCLRFLNVYGLGQNYRYPSAVQAFAEGIKKGKITIYGDGEQTRYYVHVKDVCKAIHKALDVKINSGEVIDIGGEGSISINQLAENMIQLSGKDIEVEHGPARLEIRDSTCNKNHAWKLLGFTPHISLREGLAEIINS